MPKLSLPSPLRRRLGAGLLAGVGALCLPSTPAWAALAVGASVKDFTLDAAVGGKAFRFTLSEALKQGPVVLYFYPKSFTSGCTVEAKLFSEASAQFKAMGATVIGVSNDNLDTQRKFSVEACRGQFPVAADDGGQVIRQFDAGFSLAPGVADRISYVIDPQGKVLLAYASMNPDGHVNAALQAVQRWRDQRR